MTTLAELQKQEADLENALSQVRLSIETVQKETIRQECERFRPTVSPCRIVWDDRGQYTYGEWRDTEDAFERFVDYLVIAWIIYGHWPEFEADRVYLPRIANSSGTGKHSLYVWFEYQTEPVTT